MNTQNYENNLSNMNESNSLVKSDSNQLILELLFNDIPNNSLAIPDELPPPPDDSFKGLRDYQQKVVDDIYSWYADGKNSVLTYAPTGSGKTVISAKIIADFIADGKKVLFVVHRIPLVEQTIKTVEKILGYEIKFSIYQGSNTKIDPDADITVGMVQSIKKSKLPDHVDLVVFDEVHTTAYYKIVREIKEKYQPVSVLSNTKFLGLTATPWRTKGNETFCWLFDVVVKSCEIKELVTKGYLTPPRLFGYNGLIDYTKAETSGGDYSSKWLKIVCNAQLNTEIVEKYIDFTPNKQAIAFCASVSQAEDLTSQFLNNGVKAELWVGSTNEVDRKRIQKAFRTKKIQVIVSVSCLCEGFDEPIAEVALIARPTKSIALFWQMIGRVLRLFPNKKEAFILDFCDNFSRNGTPYDPIKIALCDIKERKQGFEPPVKSCPNCGHVVNIAIRICPECGFEFKATKDKENLDVDNFGEIFATEQKEQVGYLRTQIRRIYTKLQKSFLDEPKRNHKLNPVRAKFLFKEKFGFFPPHNWYEGAIFGGSADIYHKNQYRTYLEWLFPNKLDFFYEDIMKHEFGGGKPKTRIKDPQVGSIPTGANWHIILGISRNATRQEVKYRYRTLALRHHPDLMANNERATIVMQNINLAWDYAKKHFD